MSDTTNHTAQPTGAGLLAFLDFAINKGYLKVPTGQAMKTACKEVLSAIEGDEWESATVEGLDVDDALRRFETLRAMKFSTGSLATYKSRFNKSVRMFEDFRESPGSWRPDLKPRNRTPKASAAVSETNGSSQASSHTPALQHPVRSNFIKYPFPLRDGMLAALELPSDLTKREAKRLCSFIDSIAVEEMGQLPPARADDD